MAHAKKKAGSGLVLALGTAVIATLVLLAATIRAQAQVPGGPCRLMEGRSESLSSTTCRACHPWDICHPVDVNYESALATGRFDLYGIETAIERGAFLPEGQVRCVSCHDRDSSAPAHLAIRHVKPPALPPKEASSNSRGTDSPMALCRECHMRE
jgi:hypothetical protein